MNTRTLLHIYTGEKYLKWILNKYLIGSLADSAERGSFTIMTLKSWNTHVLFYLLVSVVTLMMLYKYCKIYNNNIVYKCSRPPGPSQWWHISSSLVFQQASMLECSLMTSSTFHHHVCRQFKVPECLCFYWQIIQKAAGSDSCTATSIATAGNVAREQCLRKPDEASW